MNVLRVDYQRAGYAPDQVRKRYVRVDGFNAELRFCEVGECRAYDIRQGVVDPASVPEEIRREALARAGSWPSWVEWPL
jgi:hypothetical protein